MEPTPGLNSKLHFVLPKSLKLTVNQQSFELVPFQDLVKESAEGKGTTPVVFHDPVTHSNKCLLVRAYSREKADIFDSQLSQKVKNIDSKAFDDTYSKTNPPNNAGAQSEGGSLKKKNFGYED